MSGHFQQGNGGYDGGPAFDTNAAYEFLYRENSALENARLAHWRGEDPGIFWSEMSRYQNPDGGWGKGIDPEYMGQNSSIQSTIEALRILVAHQQGDSPQVRRTVAFLKQAAMGDGTWQELPEVLQQGAPEWYQPARFRIWETACIAGYCLELGYTELWSGAARYLRHTWPDLGQAEVPHPYWAALLLVGRSHADKDRVIRKESIDQLRRFIRREQIDPADCSWVVEVLAATDVPESDELIPLLGDRIAAAQGTDGGVETEYGESFRARATFNALMAVALMNQRQL